MIIYCYLSTQVSIVKVTIKARQAHSSHYHFIMNPVFLEYIQYSSYKEPHGVVDLPSYQHLIIQDHQEYQGDCWLLFPPEDNYRPIQELVNYWPNIMEQARSRLSVHSIHLRIVRCSIRSWTNLMHWSSIYVSLQQLLDTLDDHQWQALITFYENYEEMEKWCISLLYQANLVIDGNTLLENFSEGATIKLLISAPHMVSWQV